FPDHNCPVVDVVNDARFNSIQTDKRQPADNLFGRKNSRQCLFVAETILERQNCAARPDHRRKQTRKLIVGGGFETDQNQVGDANLLWAACRLGVDVKIALCAANGNPTPPNDFVVGTKQEMYFPSGAAKFRAIKTAQRATTDNGDFHATLNPSTIEPLNRRIGLLSLCRQEGVWAW